MEKLSRGQRRKRFFNVLMALATLVICLVVAMVSLTPQTYDVAQGEISPETITAHEDFVDERATQRLREEAQAAVPDAYVVDSEMSQQMVKDLSDWLVVLEDVRETAQQSYVSHQQSVKAGVAQDIAVAEEMQADVQAQIADIEHAFNQQQRAAEQETLDEAATTRPAETMPPTPSPVPIPTAYEIPAFNAHSVNWDDVLTAADIANMQEMLPVYMDEADLFTVISMSETELRDLSEYVLKRVPQELALGIGQQDEQVVLSALASEISRQRRLTSPQETMLDKLITNSLASNMVYDEKATLEEKQKAAELVKEVEYKKGQNIVMKGNIVSAEQYELLKDHGMLASESTSAQPYYAVAIYIIMVFFLYIIFLSVFNRRLMTDTKKVIILCLLTAICYVITTLAQWVSMNVYPIFLFVILGAVLLSPKNAIVYGVFLSLLMMSVTKNGQAGSELLSRESLVMLLNTLIGSFFAVYMLKDMRYRSRLLGAGLVAAIPGVVIAFILWLYRINPLERTLLNMLIMTASGLLCGIASIGVLPIIESVFKLITPTKLLELSAPNHPLIKRLMLEAPGTYHHSMLVANLAEAGCNAVSGFSLLARVGAYYHDVGKIENPLFFKENQRNNFNPHDNFSPYESAAILRKHVTDGVEMLKKYNMPEEIIAITSQHHGNGVAGYFYATALQRDKDVDIRDFKYDGVPPKTKEGAIVMLADCVEAAVRSMDNPSNADISNMVNKLIKERYDEGQLDNAPLNRRDLRQIAQAFINIFQGVYHQRIKYPEIKIHGAEDEDNVL